MLGNIAFTLYEILGYLVPGGVSLLGISMLYWAFFAPTVPLGFAAYEPGLVTWTALIFSAYLLGHGVQGVGNFLFQNAENAALSNTGSLPIGIRKRALDLATRVMGVASGDMEPLLVFLALDQYSIRAGKTVDRDMFVYREGFYRGTSIAMFFLSIALIVRAFVPGASIQFTRGLLHVSSGEFLFTALITSAIARIFVRRYNRFAQYRVNRAVLASLVFENFPDKDRSDETNSDAKESGSKL